MRADPTEALRAELGPGERLLWAGGPRRGVRFQASDLFLVPFGLVWCAFVGSFDLALLRGGGGEFLPTFAIAALFSGVGLYTLVGRFIYDALRRARTLYGVTDQRVVIQTTLTGRRVTSLDLRTLTELSLTERSGGRGTITFGPQGQTSHLAAAGWPMSGPVSPRFEGIPDAKKVYERIRQAQRGG